jgi:hypothetical protein
VPARTHDARALSREGMEEEDAQVKSENVGSQAEMGVGATIAAGVTAAGISATASAEDGIHAPAANADASPPKSGVCVCVCLYM